MILSQNLPPVPSRETLERWRDQLRARRALLDRQERIDPLAVEQFDYEYADTAFAVRQMLKNLLDARLATLTTRLNELREVA